jgi:S1-C subfamily serine protease
MIRLFTAQSGVDEEVATRLKRELEALKKLPEEGFVRHHAIRCSEDGLWYRISEWVDTESWGSLLASGTLQNQRVAFDLFHQMAKIISVLHQEGYFIPHLILDDIMLVKGEKGEFEVKIDYKLSRFFDPKQDRPGPMLKRLLSCHPDILNQRPLDFRSDIWSLGKIFVELLTADLVTTDFLAKVDELSLVPEVEVLLKVMLSEDPALRPRSMADVADSLVRINVRETAKADTQQIEQAAVPSPMSKRPRKRMALLAVMALLVVAIGTFGWFQFGLREKDDASVLEDYANKYARSVAFVLVEYWLQVGEEKVYHNLAEGTAFLADSQGYLITGRHVACPWLEDNALFITLAQYQLMNQTPSFGYRLFLWFEGEKAFNRAGFMMESPDPADLYFIDSAFSTESDQTLSIAGVAKPLLQTRQLVTSPLKNDFAVLKIEKVPEGLTPLPLDQGMEAQNIPKLSRIIALGFPLGSRVQEASVNVSVTSGYVRRSFENLLQIDASIHQGSSGGPIIDKRGLVIGIISGVAMDWTQGLLPVATPMSDMGMVLPITKAVPFLEKLKAGHTKWTGILDLSIPATLEKIQEKAGEGRWVEAQALAERELKQSLQPSLVRAVGMMNFCAGDYRGAKRFFTQSLSMDEEDYQAKLMLFITDWLSGENVVTPHREDLLALDWRSPAEFQGYLAKVLDGLVDEKTALESWETEEEKSWLYFIAGLIRWRREDLTQAERLMQEAVLSAETDAWSFFLARASLEQTQKKRRDVLKAEDQLVQYNREIKDFEQAVQKTRADRKERRTREMALRAGLEEEATPKQKRDDLKELYEMNPNNRVLLVNLSFYSAMDEDWEQALAYIRTFLEKAGRQNSNQMTIGLLEAGIINYQGFSERARESLEAYAQRTRDPWHLTISDYLLGKQAADVLKKQAGESPENLITSNTHLGFWAEGNRDQSKAIKYYKEALESFLDTWLEYDFVQERLKKLKKPQ